MGFENPQKRKRNVFGGTGVGRRSEISLLLRLSYKWELGSHPYLPFRVCLLYSALSLSLSLSLNSELRSSCCLLDRVMVVKSSENGSVSVPPFLNKCYDMVEDPSTDSVISWSLPGGDSFLISDVPQFSVTLLPNYFKHNNFSSFIRQLNIYVFSLSLSYFFLNFIFILLFNCDDYCLCFHLIVIHNRRVSPLYQLNYLKLQYSYPVPLLPEIF